MTSSLPTSFLWNGLASDPHATAQRLPEDKRAYRPSVLCSEAEAWAISERESRPFVVAELRRIAQEYGSENGRGEYLSAVLEDRIAELETKTDVWSPDIARAVAEQLVIAAGIAEGA